MSTRFPDDVMLPPHAATAPVRPAKIAAFLPIAIALAGVGAILLGTLTVRGTATAVASGARVDPVITGSVAPPRDIRNILEKLDD